jgi:hypothetical protein
MTSFNIAWSLLGITSFVLYLIFYKKLKPSPFWGKWHPANFWATTHLMLSIPQARDIIGIFKGKQMDISTLLSFALIAATGIIMVILAGRVTSMELQKRLADEIEKRTTTRGNETHD